MRGRSDLSSRNSHPFDDLPLLRITDARGVQPIGELIGGACGVMAHEGCSEVLRNPCAFTLGDEPLASGVEHGPVQLRMEAAEVGIALHDTIHAEIREQPTRRWQSSIQQPFQHPMQWHFSLCSLGLQQANPVWPDTNKPPQVPLGWVLSDE